MTEHLGLIMKCHYQLQANNCLGHWSLAFCFNLWHKGEDIKQFKFIWSQTVLAFVNLASLNYKLLFDFVILDGLEWEWHP